MTTREYVGSDAPLISGPFFAQSITDEQKAPVNYSRPLLLSEKTPQPLIRPSMQYSPSGAKPAPQTLTSSYLSSQKPFSANVNPYLPSSQGLSRFLSAPSVHLSPAGIFTAGENGASAQSAFPVYSASKFSSATQLNTGSLKQRMIGKDGQRLPSVVKKALPLPPEDIRSVPHVRAQSRPESPPVVSIGMCDMEGVPIPWRKTPELLPSIGASSKILNGESRRSGSPADDVRQQMRLDFDNLEIFIEEAFAGARTKPPMD